MALITIVASTNLIAGGMGVLLIPNPLAKLRADMRKNQAGEDAYSLMHMAAMRGLEKRFFRPPRVIG
jgi:hypothetical protein